VSLTALAIVLARRKLFRAKCEEGENIEEFLRKLQEYREELATLSAPISDDEFNITILTALPDSWDSFTSALDANILKNSAELIARIMEQDRRQKSKNADGEAVLAAKGKNNFRRNNNQRETNRDQKETRECFYCKKKGHLQKDCRKRKREKGSESSNVNTDQKKSDEYAFPAIEAEEVNLTGTSGRNSWIGDSATTRHCANDMRHFTEYREEYG